jgi:hypothetical protein
MASMESHINHKAMADFSAKPEKPSELKASLAQGETEVSEEFVQNAKMAIRDFLCLKKDEKIALMTGETSNPEMIEILKQAAERLGVPLDILTLTKETKRKEVAGLFKDHEIIMDISLESAAHPACQEMYDEDLENSGARLAYVPGLEPSLFRDGGALTENREDLEYRLNRMEEVLKDAVGFRVTSQYGTNLTVPLREGKQRTWFKEDGTIGRKGQWNNMPGGEIFTTPDEQKVSGTLVLPALDRHTGEPTQGVDEFVRLEIKDGVIVGIGGGKSAEILKKQLAQAAEDQLKAAKSRKAHSSGWITRKEKDFKLTPAGKDKGIKGIIDRANDNIATESNPHNVLRIAEIAFGANSKARGVGENPDQPYTSPATPTIEAEKRLGTMHLAFGDSRHGEEGTEGFRGAASHLDFVVPRNGLTVEMFVNQTDFNKGKNGRKIISEGGLKFFE